jgi:acyl-CoA thioesterase-1
MMVVFSAIVFLGAALLWAQNARDQIEDAPDLPRVLLIGDSIRGGYMNEVRELLKGKANVHWPPVNCGGTWESLSKTKGKGHIDEWLGDGDWDVIHFNWGLWDINRWIDGKRNMQGAIVATEEEYAERLEELVERMEKTGATLIWASTTYVQGGWGRHAGDEYRYNEVAEEIMDKHGILINDLHALSASFPLYGEADAEQGEKEMWRSEGNVHFSEAGSQKLAEQVAYAIKMVLEQDPSIFVRSL